MNATVYQNKQGKVVIVIKQSASTVYVIEADDTLQHVIVGHRQAEFYKQFTACEYSPSKAAQKFLTRKQFTTSAQAEIALKEIIMNDANVIVVSPDASFIGRFADPQTAATCSPDNALCITSAADFEGEHFTKAVLIAALAEDVDKKITKAQLAERLYAKYKTQEVTIMEKEKKQKKQKEVVEREPSVITKLRKLFTAGNAVNVEAFAAECGKSVATVKSQINRLKSEKLCGEGGPLSIVSGHQDGVLFYVLAEHKDSFEWDAKAERKSRGTGEGRQPKTDGPVYKVHEFLNANPEIARKDALSQLVEMGINKSTATTQYGVWKKASKQAA